MSLRELQNLGLPEVYDNAASIIKNRGLAKGLRIDPATGSVDLVAALAIALGANEKVLFNSVSLVDTGIPETKEAVLHLAMDYLDSVVLEPESWADLPTTSGGEVERFLRQAAMRLRVAVV